MTIVASSADSQPCLPPPSASYKTDIKRVLPIHGEPLVTCFSLRDRAYTAAMFHLMTHAFFKALFVLTAGSSSTRSRASKTFERWAASARKSHTYRLFLIGTVAIAGIPPLQGSEQR